jgi:hypothetical protein
MILMRHNPLHQSFQELPNDYAENSDRGVFSCVAQKILIPTTLLSTYPNPIIA